MALYPALYEKFALLQADPLAGARLVYPTKALSISLAADISDCVVGIPAVCIENKRLLYGPFVLPHDDFGRYAAARLVLASTCLLGSKTAIMWRYRQAVEKWVAGKRDPIRASYVANIIFDARARQRIKDAIGVKFYNQVFVPADMLSAALLPSNSDNLPAFFQSTLALSVLGAPSIHVPFLIRGKTDDIVNSLQAIKNVKDWEHLGNSLYDIIENFPGGWHTVYLPYSAPISGQGHREIFRSGAPDRMAFERFMRGLGHPTDIRHDSIGDEIYFEISREHQRREKILAGLERTSKNLNLGSFGFPASDYAGYHRLFSEMAPQVRRMIEQARLVRNVLDESTFEESGNVDLQVAIQAIASETARPDMFAREEELLKNESWAILIDSSLSLGGLAKQLRSIALSVAETAKDIIGRNPWGMFTFSDDLLCIKDFSEPYDMLSKSRIGGLTPDGLSHIPDALRLACRLVLEHAQDRNYIILVSDGLSSGYSGIEKEMSVAVKELYSHGVTLAAIGVGGSGIKKSVPNSKLVGEPVEMARAFSELYFALSS